MCDEHLEEIHVTWTQFGKKLDKDAILWNFNQAWVYRSWRRCQDFHLMSSWFQDDDVTSFYGDVKVADIEESLRTFDGLTTSGLTSDAVRNGVEIMSSGVSRFLSLASEGAYVIYSILEELGMDQWAVASENRALMCTEVALCVAAGWLGAYLRAWIVVMLVWGPCT
nr:protein transport protein SEC23-like [Tanacetum cinerariifolium]